MDYIGDSICELCKELFPICRSITGNGVRETLNVIKTYLPNLKIFEIPSGTKCFDWTIPKEWNIKDAYIIDPKGNKICDFKENNLHVVSYSIPINKEIPLEELNEHLYSLPTQPNAIPYVTSYYKERWGFCLTHKQKTSLTPGKYRVHIDSELKEGHLTYGELILPGKSKKEIFLSTYICHPSLANNELSGPTVTTFLAKWLETLKDRFYTYRIIFIPETIGSITYLSKNIKVMQQNIIAGFNVTCVGDNRAYSFLPSRKGDTLADKIAQHVLKHLHPDFISYSYLERGSDERQYCSAGVDLPVASIMRTKYGMYPEYHTSLDNLDLISPAGLFGSYEVLKKCIECLENNWTLKNAVLCEPQLGKRGLYPTISTKNSGNSVRNMMNLIAYSDNETLFNIAEKTNLPMWDLIDTANKLVTNDVLKAYRK